MIDTQIPAMTKNIILNIDRLIQTSLTQLASDKHVQLWRAKERDWVNYYAHRYLIDKCNIKGPLKHAAQIGIEVGVPQPKNYQRLTVCRDIVIWPDIGKTCWDMNWKPRQHPLAILEWKVHRPGHRNMKVNKEREWLRAYCKWQPMVVAYAVEVHGDKTGCPLTCTRFLGKDEKQLWIDLRCS